MASATDALRLRRAGPHTVVHVAGELDSSTAPALRDGLLGLVNRGVASLVVDLRDVTFVDSTGLGTLLRIHHRQGLLGGRLHLVADQPAVLRVLDLMQLRPHLHVAPSVADVARCPADSVVGEPQDTPVAAGSG